MGCLEDRELRSIIRKDVRRTMQEYQIFKLQSVQDNMDQILFIWAKQYPDFKYQQGMNDILAVILVTLFSEIN
jgi:TBC1 domain family protein 5